jgi:hypothetical protein
MRLYPKDLNYATYKNVPEISTQMWSVTQESFSLPESILDKSKAHFRRLQNSPESQTVVIADLVLRQDLLAKMFSMAAQYGYFLGNRPEKFW